MAFLGNLMPCLSQFYGVAIYMYYRDHTPPHFHAIYGDKEAVIEIATGSVLAGKLPRRAHSLVDDWLAIHRDELQNNWSRALAGQSLSKISPLD